VALSSGLLEPPYYNQATGFLELKKIVLEMSAAERAELKAFLDELEADDWDKQIAQDQAEGRLDALIADVKAEIKAGKIKPL
jgi:phage shock protein A